MTDYFAGDVAARYDAGLGVMGEPAVLDRTIDVLAELAGDGAALEFAIGTGRVALALHQRGVPVAGIDFSPDMVAQLRAKPGADGIAVTIGNIATTRVEGSFTLVYLVFNTIMNLTTQDEQVACFTNAAAHLEPDGCFVVEVGVPDLRRLPPGQTVVPFHIEPDYAGFDEYTDLTAAQQMSSHHYRVADGRGRVASVPFRYVWPAELDLMARLAGLSLRHRWASWTRDPFTSDSPSHVSIWQKPPGDPAHPNWVYSRSMGKVIQVRNVPDNVHRDLRRRAAEAGVSLSDYVLDELCRVAVRNQNAEILRRLSMAPGGASHEAIREALDSGRTER